MIKINIVLFLSVISFKSVVSYPRDYFLRYCPINYFSNYVILITSRGALEPSQPPIPWQPGLLPDGKAASAKDGSSYTFTLL
jgi:hypothetical protein